jgi:hypothetical protein
MKMEEMIVTEKGFIGLRILENGERDIMDIVMFKLKCYLFSTFELNNLIYG